MDVMSNSAWGIHKFGGTSLANSDCFRRVGEILAGGKTQRIAIVVSAMAGTTDALLELVSLAECRGKMVGSEISSICAHQIDVASDLLPTKILAAFALNVEGDCKDITDILHATSLLRSAPKRIRDVVSGYGELWSARLLTGYLASLVDTDVRFMDARDALVVTPQPASGNTVPRDRGPAPLVPQDLKQGLEKLGPEILLPTKNPGDTKMWELGEVVIRKSNVYDRMLEARPRVTKSFLDSLILDALIAREAKQHSITVDPKKVDAVVQNHVVDLRRQVAKDWKQLTFDQYCQLHYGMSGARSYQDWRRLTYARQLYRGYVIRYLAMLQDRVQVRVFAHTDRKVVEEVRERARKGADFKTLVLLKRSEDVLSNRNGGLLQPFARDYPRPFTAHAFQLKPGDLSEVVVAETGSAKMHYLLYCLKRMPGRNVRFEEVRKELDEELSKNPVEPEERKSLHIRLRTRSKSLRKPAPDR